MDKVDLFRSRQVWVALFRSGAKVESSVWTDWADSKIRSLDVPPEWVKNLSLADDNDDAMDAVRTNIGREYAPIGAEALNDEALLIGFVYERYAAGKISESDMWATLNREVDFAQFMDGEKRTRFSQIPGPSTEMTGLTDDIERAEVAKMLASLGASARQQAKEQLRISTFL